MDMFEQRSGAARRKPLARPLAAALAWGLALVAAAAPMTARAQATDYPKAPVRIIVGFAPGGGVDLVARYLAKILTERTGQSFFVENRPGAAGNIGAAAVAHAKPDGYTLLATSVVHSVNPSLFPNLPFDPVKDFAPVTTVGLSPVSFAVNANSPIKTMADLVKFAKANPGKLTYSSSGGATLMYLGMAQFESQLGIKLLHVPYAGAGPSVLAAVSGQVDMTSSGYGAVEPFSRGGQLRMLGVATAKPSPLAPGVPTIADGANLPGFEVVSWQGILAPAGTPREIVEKLATEISEAQKHPEMQAFMAKQGVEPFVLTPAKFGDLIKSGIVRYRKIVKDTGATAN